MFTKPQPQQHFSRRCKRNQCHSNISLADVHETNAAARFLQPMPTKPTPHQHFFSQCVRNLCHNNISPVDVHETNATANVSLAGVNETNATATFPQLMCKKSKPQQHVFSQCAPNLSHGNISPAHVHETTTAAAFLESGVRSLCLCHAGIMIFSVCHMFRSRPSLPVDCLQSGLGGYRVALTIQCC